MKILIWLAFKLRLKQKFWGDLYIKQHTAKVNKLIETIDLDVSNIKLIRKL